MQTHHFQPIAYHTILTVGNARPLDQALQEATTEMVRWLVELGLEGTLA